jgi:cyclopropane-fatty-acyl-phospholipid synthase
VRDALIRHAPDLALRLAARASIRNRLAAEHRRRPEERRAFVDELHRSPIARSVELANEQHYEVDSRFFELVLGPRLKYSCCLWPEGVRDLRTAEGAMLSLTCERAGIEDGMEILDLGCGWGSLTSWIAEHYPRCRVLAVSNSRTQRTFVEARGIPNVEVVTADANEFDPGRRFDRVVSVEMLEHVRNYGALFRRIAGWLEPDGKLFAHVFSHRSYAYPFTDSWMARTFFTGGTMPSHDLLPGLARGSLELEADWVVDGTHYRRTLEAWLARLDENRERVLPVLAETYGPGREEQWLANWRLFLIACAELFGTRGGSEWQVSHYRFGLP